VPRRFVPHRRTWTIRKDEPPGRLWGRHDRRIIRRAANGSVDRNEPCAETVLDWRLVRLMAPAGQHALAPRFIGCSSLTLLMVRGYFRSRVYFNACRLTVVHGQWRNAACG
jgi:hypothetical protein